MTIIDYIINSLLFNIPESILLVFSCIIFLRKSLYELNNIVLVFLISFLSYYSQNLIIFPFDRIFVTLIGAFLFKLLIKDIRYTQVILCFISVLLGMLFVETVFYLPILSLYKLNIESNILITFLFSIPVRFIEFTILYLSYKKFKEDTYEKKYVSSHW